MAITYDIDQVAGRVTATAEGTLSLDQVLATLADLVKDPDFEPGFDRLWDLCEAQPDLSCDHVRAIARVVEALGQTLGGRRTAIVACSALAYGLARMYTAFSEGVGPETNVFGSREEAIKWLQEVAA